MIENRFLGEAGHGLNDASWASSQNAADIGRDGELRTAALLETLPNRGLVVLHDIVIRQGKYTANVDHAVVSGDQVLLIDTKVWARGTYWSLGSRVYRGFKRARSAEKKTMTWAADVIDRACQRRGVHVKIAPPVRAVWPYGSGMVRTWLLRGGECVHVPGARIASYVSRRCRRPADDAIVDVLSSMLSTPPSVTSLAPAPNPSSADVDPPIFAPSTQTFDAEPVVDLMPVADAQEAASTADILREWDSDGRPAA